MHNTEIRNSLINGSEIGGKALALNAFHFIYNQVVERLKIKHASPLAGRKTSLFYFMVAIRIVPLGCVVSQDAINGAAQNGVSKKNPICFWAIKKMKVDGTKKIRSATNHF